MDELAWRVVIVVLVAGVAVAVGLAGRRPRRSGGIPGLPAGVTAFTSASCDQCAPARAVLDRVLGRGAWVEMRLEDHRDLFVRASISEVPLVAITRSDGGQEVRTGVPSARWLRRAQAKGGNP